MTISKPKTVTVTNAKKKAWTAFSLFIRARDCLATTHNLEFGICFTCGRTYPFKKLQAGHFIPGRHNGVLLEPKLVRAQCYSCNIGLKGNWVPFRRNMVLIYGEAEVQKMEDMRKGVAPIVPKKAFEWQEEEKKFLGFYKFIVATGILPPECEDLGSKHRTTLAEDCGASLN